MFRGARRERIRRPHEFAGKSKPFYKKIHSKVITLPSRMQRRPSRQTYRTNHAHPTQQPRHECLTRGTRLVRMQVINATVKARKNRYYLLSEASEPWRAVTAIELHHEALVIVSHLRSTAAR
jgi:hypothetical protein